MKEVSLHTFKTTGDKFYLKEDMTCESGNLVHVVICSRCNEEYIGETGEGRTRVQDRVRVYRQHIRQLQYQQLKCDEHFKTFPFFKLHSQNKYLREQCEKYFRDKFKPMLH